MGARGFLGRQIEKILRNSGIHVVGTTRKLEDGDPTSWIEYDFPRDHIGERIRDLRFDFVIIAARLARANIEAKHPPSTEAMSFNEMFDTRNSDQFPSGLTPEPL